MIAILQLERMGDIVQTLPALHALAAFGEETLLVTQPSTAGFARVLAPACVAIRPVDSVLLERLLGAERDGAEADALVVAAGDLAAALALPAEARVLNLTWDTAGGALASAIAGDAAWGPRLGTDRRLICRGFWGQAVVAAVDARPQGRVHLVEMRRLAALEASGRVASPAGSRAHGGRATAGRASGAPGRADATAGRERVLLVVGAGDPVRQVPAATWGALADALVEAGFSVELIGGPEDREVAVAVQAAARARLVDRCGEAELEELPDLLVGARLVVGADTGPIHLAGWLGIPQVMLLCGNAHVWETGPRTPGSVAVQALPLGARDAASIPAASIAAAIDVALGGVLRAPRDEQLWVAHEAPAGDPLGGVVYAPPGERPSDATLLARALLARLSGSLEGGFDGSCPDDLFAVLSQVSARSREAEIPALAAATLLAEGRLEEAALQVQELGVRFEAVAAAATGHGASAAFAAALRCWQENLEAAGPAAVVAAHRRMLRRVAWSVATLA